MPELDLNCIRPETLLAGSDILSTVEGLAKEIAAGPTADSVSFIEFFSRLQSEADDLPRLKLDPAIPPGTESEYSMRLGEAVESIVDSTTRLQHKVGMLQGKVRGAMTKIKEVSAAFQVWYSLALQEALKAKGLKLSASAIDNLASNEFSRLMKGVNIDLEILDSSQVKMLNEQIKNHRKAQYDKYVIGKDQVNASFTQCLPDMGHLHRLNLEEDDDSIPAFESKKSSAGKKFKVGDPQKVSILE